MTKVTLAQPQNNKEKLMRCHARIKSVFIFLLFSPLSFAMLGAAHAAPAFPGISKVVQPNSASISVRLRGDEWNNWVETVGGFTIAQSRSGYWEYVISYDEGTPILSGIRAELAPPENVRRGVGPSVVVPVFTEEQNKNTRKERWGPPYGKFKGNVLFILAEFKNVKGTYSQNSFAKMLKTDIARYYKRASNNRVKIIPAKETHGKRNNGVVGWINLGYNHPNTRGNTSKKNRDLAKKAIIKANKYVNFKSYDKNKDGYTDSDELAVVVIVAGYESSYSAKNPGVWGHAWSIWPLPKVDGVYVGRYRSGVNGYTQVGERQGDHQATIGIIAHEIGHQIFGLPDLYDTDGSSDGIGVFGLMGGGSWGKRSVDRYAGQTPVLPCAWTKYEQEWVNAKKIKKGRRVIKASGMSATGVGTVYVSETGRSGEYFLIEHRNATGYDKGLQTTLGKSFGGLAIWHVDDNAEGKQANDRHRHVDLEEADRTETYGEKTDLWFSGNAVSFNNTSKPNSKRYHKKKSNVCINKIGKAGKVSISAIWGC